MQKEYEFYSLGMGGKSIIKIDGNTLTISRPGLVSKMSLGFTGDKTIMINQISGVQIKKVGLARGYIQFIMAGTKETKSGIIGGKIDENVVYSDSSFKRSNKQINDDFEEIKKYIEDFNNNQNNTTVVQNVKSPVEQVKELKELLDMGAISQEEFDKKKKELLDL